MIFLIFKFILAYAVAGMIGYLLLSVLDRRNLFSAGLKLFAGLLLGMGIFTLTGFAAAVFGAGLTASNLLLIAAANIGLLIVFHLVMKRNFSIAEFFLGLSLRKVFHPVNLLFVLLILKILVGFWQVAHVPTFEFDAWNNWNIRAKVIYMKQELPLDQADPFYLGGGIKSYPLNDGLWKVWLANIAGSWNESFVNASSVATYIILLGLFYFLLPVSFSHAVKTMLTFLLGGIPFIYFHSWIPYVDLLFASYVLLSIGALFWFFKTRHAIYLYPAAIAMGILIWTKNEGFAVVAPMVFLLTFRYWKYWTVAVLTAAPWLIFRFVSHLDVLSGDSSSFEPLLNSQFFGEAFSSVFLRSHFNFLWLLLFGLILFRIRAIWTDPPKRFLTAAVIGLFVFYNGIILFTDKAFDLSALVRVNLHIAPLGFFLLIILLSELVPDMFSRASAEGRS